MLPLIQRQSNECPIGPAQEKDPNDLTGTKFEVLDEGLREKLVSSNFKGDKPTLAQALCDQTNATIASMARVGGMVSSSARFLWRYVGKIKPGWVSDNFGFGVEWNNPGGLAGALVGNDGWCRDFWPTARHYHKTFSAFRQIPGKPGAASLHVATEGTSDIHVDVHQPVEGKEFWGTCDYNLDAWKQHERDVEGGGGARGTPVGRFSHARGRSDPNGELANKGTEEEKRRLAEAYELLNQIQWKVQKYAAMGQMSQEADGPVWAGDREMLKDKETMRVLEQAEALIREVEDAQKKREEEEAKKWRRSDRFPKY